MKKLVTKNLHNIISANTQLGKCYSQVCHNVYLKFLCTIQTSTEVEKEKKKYTKDKIDMKVNVIKFYFDTSLFSYCSSISQSCSLSGMGTN